MISKIDTTLKTYLIKELGEPADTELDFSFKLPDRSWLKSSQNSKNWINIYLLEVKENLELRKNEWQRSDNIDRVHQKKSPSYVDLYYLITFYNKEKKSEVEHQYLESVLMALFDFSNLAPEHISDVEFLKQITLELFPKPYIDDQLGFQFWNAIDQDARPYIPLKVTIPLESKITKDYKLVKEDGKTIALYHKSSLYGRVLVKEQGTLDNTAKPYEGQNNAYAKVKITNQGGTTIYMKEIETDALGMFEFAQYKELHLDEKELFLKANAEDYDEKEIKLAKDIKMPIEIILIKN